MTAAVTIAPRASAENAADKFVKLGLSHFCAHTTFDKFEKQSNLPNDFDIKKRALSPTAYGPSVKKLSIARRSAVTPRGPSLPYPPLCPGAVTARGQSRQEWRTSRTHNDPEMKRGSNVGNGRAADLWSRQHPRRIIVSSRSVSAPHTTGAGPSGNIPGHRTNLPTYRLMRNSATIVWTKETLHGAEVCD